MDAKHRKHLQKSYMKLHQNIANVKAVVGSLYSSGILTDRMKSEIMDGHKTDYGRIGKLLDILPLRGPDAYLGFLHALEENGEIAADIIREGLQDSSTTSDSQHQIPNSVAIPVGSPAVKPTTLRWNRPLPKENDELPKTWPLCVHVVQVRSDDAYMLDKFDQATKGNENMYTMSRISPRGVALIINNRDFGDADLDREGSQYDEVSLDQLFKQLGYETVIENDCTAKKMRDVINALAQADHSEYDSFVCAVMSHGNEGKVYGVDGYAVDLKKLIFRMESCKSLSGKPKLFFIQACQGSEDLVEGEVDDGVREDTTVKELLQSSLVPGKIGGSAKDGTAVKNLLPSSLVPGKVDGSAKDGTAVKNLPPSSLVPGKVDVSAKDGTAVQKNLQWSLVTEKVDGSAKDDTASQQSTDSEGKGISFTSKTDVFIAMATVPDFVSWRNIYIGSWFVQAVAYVFSHLSHKYDLNSLMSRVNRLVSRGCDNHKRKQVSIYNTTLTKDFFFFPGLQQPKPKE